MGEEPRGNPLFLQIKPLLSKILFLSHLSTLVGFSLLFYVYPISGCLLATGALPAKALGGQTYILSVSIYFPHGARQIHHTGPLRAGALHLRAGALHLPPVGMLH